MELKHYTRLSLKALYNLSYNINKIPRLKLCFATANRDFKLELNYFHVQFEKNIFVNLRNLMFIASPSNFLFEGELKRLQTADDVIST